jgi:outer membrane protein assembly factor BamE (lipoprotein component of BamABCDE complex)
MRAVAVIAILGVLPPLSFAAGKQLTWEDRVEITRGLVAEYATAKVLIPRSKKALEFDSNGSYDKKAWTAVARESGPAARSGDTIQITKVSIETDRLVLEINHGFKGGRKWYDGVNVGMGPSMDPATVPVSRGDSNAPGGTSIVILFHKELEPIKAAEIKKMLAPVMDFEKHSVTEIYSETLPPEMQKAIKEKRALVGMTHEQVLMAMGRPQHKSREPDADGGETEDWVFGVPPGKITFVTFNGDKVIKVKEDYAGLGTIQNPQPVIR